MTSTETRLPQNLSATNIENKTTSYDYEMLLTNVNEIATSLLEFTQKEKNKIQQERNKNFSSKVNSFDTSLDEENTTLEKLQNNFLAHISEFKRVLTENNELRERIKELEEALDLDITTCDIIQSDSKIEKVVFKIQE